MTCGKIDLLIDMMQHTGIIKIMTQDILWFYHHNCLLIA